MVHGLILCGAWCGESGSILCSLDVGSGAERDQLICYLDCFVSDVYLIHSISEDFKYKIEAIPIPTKIVFVY